MNNSKVITLPFKIEQFVEIFGLISLQCNTQFSNDLDIVQSNTVTFDFIIDFLRLDFDDLTIKERFNTISRAIGNKDGMLTAMHPDINDVKTCIIGNPPIIAILLPFQFYLKFQIDMLFYVGSIVHAGFCADYCKDNLDEFIENPNGQIVKNANNLANIEEGRFFNLFYSKHPEIEISSYHQKLITLYFENL
jgi:hypothetical protein